jgi:two-component system, NarL family, nitrate/nitrite response regulator NarL
MDPGHQILVVDDRRLVAEAIAAFLNGSGLTARAIPSSDLDGVVPVRGLALVSLGTASRGEHIATLAAARWRVVVYGIWDEGQVAQAVSDGAVGFVSGASSIEDLGTEVRGVLAGTGGFSVVERSRLAALAHQARDADSGAARGLASLTPRECEVLDALLEGRRVADIAADSYVSVTTVRNQVQSILTKLNVHSQLEAVAVARRHRWEDEPH